MSKEGKLNYKLKLGYLGSVLSIPWILLALMNSIPGSAVRPGTGFSVESVTTAKDSKCRSDRLLTKSVFSSSGSRQNNLPWVCEVLSLQPVCLSKWWCGKNKKNPNLCALYSFKDEVRRLFPPVCVQNEEENETSLPFFNQLSHTTMIVMARVFGKGVVCTICERRRHRVKGLFVCSFAGFQRNKRKRL